MMAVALIKPSPKCRRREFCIDLVTVKWLNSSAARVLQRHIETTILMAPEIMPNFAAITGPPSICGTGRPAVDLP